MGDKVSGESGRWRRGAASVAVGALVFALSAGGAHAVVGSIVFVEFDKDGVAGVDGLDGARGVAVSSDGVHVYATGANDDALAAFARDPATGALSLVEVEKDGSGGVDGLDVARGVATSPDGAHVYVASGADSAVAAFARDPATGALSFVEVEKDGSGGVDGLAGASDVVISADGAHVYVVSEGDSAMAVFARDPATGALSFVEAEMDGVGGVEGLASPRGVGVSLDGAHVYAAGFGDDAVATFARNATTGALSFVEFDQDGVAGVDGLDGTRSVVASPDGAHVYVTSQIDDAVATFSRDPATGALSFVEFDQDGMEGVGGMGNARGVVPSPDGAHVYVASGLDDAVATFSRDPATGALSFVEFDTDGAGGVDGLDGASEITASPDGAHVYAASEIDDAVATFAREAPPVDTTPPQTEITKSPANKPSKPKAKYRFTASEPGSTFECKLKGKGLKKKVKQFNDCDSPRKYKRLDQGKFRFQVRAIDAAGNVDPTPAKDKFRVVG